MTQPIWLEKEGRINELYFCREFLARNPLHYYAGSFLTDQGRRLDDREIQDRIFHTIGPYVATGLAKKVDSLLRALRLAAYAPAQHPRQDRIYFANGTWHLRGEFQAEESFCPHRLPVTYDETAHVPFRWLSFLEELLEPEDIPTLQEYLGYCLIPSTRGQKMLVLIGRGGEGKSRITQVMQAILGDNMYTSSIQKVECNRFARADLEGKFLMVDDDMDLAALPKTNYIKTIVTAEGTMDVERKGIQSYQTRLHARFLCFGNGALTALYDRSDGFFRRQILLTARPKPLSRQDDPYLTEKLLAEKEGIVLWMLEGLQRLVENGYRFTISPQAQENLSQLVRSSTNVADFLTSQGYVEFHPEGEAATSQLYDAYRSWCLDNAETAHSMRSFSQYLSQNAQRFALTPTNNIYLSGRKRCRGYVGIQLGSV